MRILCIYIPHFPLNCEIQRHPELAGHKAAIVFAEGSQKLILDYASGLKCLQHGMPLQQALSMYGGMEILQADMQYYWSVFNRILDELELKSPLVEGLEPGNIYIGIDGMQLIYSTDEMLAKDVRETVPSAFESRIGIAEGKFAAFMAAFQSRAGDISILNGMFPPFLSRCPAISCRFLLKSKKDCINSVFIPWGSWPGFRHPTCNPSSGRRAAGSNNWPGGMTIPRCIPA